MATPFSLKPNTKHLIHDVRELVRKNQPVPMAPGEWIIATPTLINFKNKALRLADRNKRNIVLAIGGGVATGLLTGGIAPALYAAAKVTSIGGKRIYRYFEEQNALDSIKFYFGNDIVNPDGTTRDLDFKGQETDSKDIPYFRAILFKIQSILSHRDFANLVNHFKDLVNSGEEFQKEWKKDWNTFNSCSDYIRLIEVTERHRYNYGRLASSIYFFRQLVNFIWDRSDAMLTESPALYRKFLQELVRQKSSTDGAIEALNDAANSDQVFHRFTTFGKKNYLDFIEKDFKLLGVHDVLPFKAKHYLNNLSRDDGIDKGLLNIIRDEAGNALSAENQNIHGIVSTAAGGQVTGQTAKLAGIAPDVGMGTSIGMAGGEFVANIVTQIANGKWNERRHTDKDRWDWSNFGFEKMTPSEAIANVERLTKGELESLVRKFDHWITSHKEFKVNFGAESIEKSAVRALRARKHYYQSIESPGFKYLMEMYYYLVDYSRDEFEKVFGDEDIRETLTPEELMYSELDDFFDQGHPNHPCSGYCYQRTKILYEYYSKMDPTVAELPLKPISSRTNIAKIEV